MFLSSVTIAAALILTSEMGNALWLCLLLLNGVWVGVYLGVGTVKHNLKTDRL